MAVTETLFFCSRDGLRIRGMQFLPDGFDASKSYPAVILSHGFTGNYLSMEEWGRSFAEMGYAAFSFNFCGGGRLYETEPIKSEGKTTDMTISTEIADLKAVKAYSVSQPFVDSEHVLLLGVSQGGFVSALTAAECQKEVEKLILIYPAFCIPDHARKGCLGGATYSPDNVPETIDCGKTILGRCFHDDVVQRDPFREILAYEGPVLIIHGLDDQTVDYTYSVRAKESYKKGQCSLRLVPGMGHGYDEEQYQSMFETIREFLKK